MIEQSPNSVHLLQTLQQWQISFLQEKNILYKLKFNDECNSAENDVSHVRILDRKKKQAIVNQEKPSRQIR